MPHRRPATGLDDETVERVVIWTVQLTGQLDLIDTSAVLFTARRHHASGDVGWPRTIDDVERALTRARRRRLLRLVGQPDPAWSALRSTAPSGAA